MNNKKGDNLIRDILNSQKPDKNVLSTAKCIMADINPIWQRIKRQFYALSGCAAVLIIAGVIFAALNAINNEHYATLQSAGDSNHFDNRFLFPAISLIFIGVVLAITAIIIRIKIIRANELTE